MGPATGATTGTDAGDPGAIGTLLATGTLDGTAGAETAGAETAGAEAADAEGATVTVLTTVTGGGQVGQVGQADEAATGVDAAGWTGDSGVEAEVDTGAAGDADEATGAGAGAEAATGAAEDSAGCTGDCVVMSTSYYFDSVP